MLGAELAYDPKIKVVTLLEFYNFVLGCIAMQSFKSDVQFQSIIQHENDDLHYSYDLETKLALVMNTKVVPCDIINMFNVLLGFHNHLYIGYK